MVLGLKPIGKLITRDKYLGVKGLHDGSSSWKLVLVPSNSLEQLNGALVRANPQKAEPRSCIVLGLKPMVKLITRDKYLSVRQNQGLAWSSDSNLWEN